MKILNFDEEMKKSPPLVALIYGAPGTGKSTALGKFIEQTDGKTLLLDVDRTFGNAMRKAGFDISGKVDIVEIDNINTFKDYSDTLAELNTMHAEGKLVYQNICIDNISELERCILSDLGRQGKNKGVPAQADYQYMQFKLVNSLRLMKSWGVNVFWTAWETVEQFQNPDGSSYNRQLPKVSQKIVDNICGLCDVVAKLHVNKDGVRGFILESMQNVYAKNQRDDRKGCKVEEFLS